MSVLDTLIFGYRKLFLNGIEQIKRDSIDLIGAEWDVTDNPTTGRSELTFTPNPLNVGAISRTLFVDVNYAGGSSDGTIAKPFTTLQDAIDAVPATATSDFNATQILVAPGTYSGNPTVLVNQQISLAPWVPLSVTDGQSTGTGCPVTMTGHFVWDLRLGSAGMSFLGISGFNVAGLSIDESVASASSRFLTISDCTFSDTITATGTCLLHVGIERSQFSAAVTLPDALDFFIEASMFLAALTAQQIKSTNSAFIGAVTASGSTLLAKDSVFQSLSVAIGTVAILDDYTLRTSALFGGLPTPVDSSGGNVWTGSAGYYQLQHTIRRSTGDVTANLGDETIHVAPSAGQTKTVTLPDAATFASSPLGDETNGGVARRPARHMRIKNTGHATSVVYVAPAGTDLLETGTSTGTFFLASGCGVNLVPAFDGSAWGWQTDDRTGTNHLFEVVAAQSQNNTNIFADKLTHNCPVQDGVYELKWSAVISVDNVDTICEARLINSTTSTVIGAVHFWGKDTDLNDYIGGTSYQTFTEGAGAQTFKVQFRRASGTGNAQMEDVHFEIRRVR